MKMGFKESQTRRALAEIMTDPTTAASTIESLLRAALAALTRGR
jgi:hypothetical protein